MLGMGTTDHRLMKLSFSIGYQDLVALRQTKYTNAMARLLFRQLWIDPDIRRVKYLHIILFYIRY